jgi:trimethylamine--corrinoid protein Co-methyltransferase
MSLFSDPQALPAISLFSLNEIQRLWEGAIRVLLTTGFRIQSEEILKRLEKRGAEVNWAEQVFRPTRAMVDALIDTAQRRAPISTPSAILRCAPTGSDTITYNGTLMYDSEQRAQRPATLRDVEDMLKVCHVLPETADFGPTVTAQDVPTLIEPIVSFALAIQTTDAIVHRVELVLPQQLPYLEALDSITQGREVRYTYDGCAVNNFTVDARAMECLLATWRRNGLEEWSVYSCPVAGASAPITVAGSVVVGLAETLGAWFAGWSLNEEARLLATPCSGVMDMATTRVLFSAPEAILSDAGIFQVLFAMTGVRAYMLADYTDAKAPGMQAMNDKVSKSLAYAWLTGQLNRQRGTLEAGKAFSPTQMVIDFELNRQIDRLARGIEVDDESMGLGLIEQFGPRFGTTYLGAEHTARHFRSAQWMPRLMDRTCWEGPAAELRKERQIVERAEARWRKALKSYERPNIPEEKMRAVDEVVTAACRQLDVAWLPPWREGR